MFAGLPLEAVGVCLPLETLKSVLGSVFLMLTLAAAVEVGQNLAHWCAGVGVLPVLLTAKLWVCLSLKAAVVASGHVALLLDVFLLLVVLLLLHVKLKLLTWQL